MIGQTSIQTVGFAAIRATTFTAALTDIPSVAPLVANAPAATVEPRNVSGHSGNWAFH
ncbi:hypothetical protein PENSUB_3329 [Penicillium subrubescens]|uniref:Uncharacterized protein n=2 Tax=Penicillium subrubescens TaxID=1316194 RepID=A0A1Q5UF99_9EURO|nr:hypothetical protein PENSUB_3329 [Penicillium subrubescens]